MPKKRKHRSRVPGLSGPRRPHDTIPNTYADVPFEGLPEQGLTQGGASWVELQAAGFHGGPHAPPPRRHPGRPPLSELAVPGMRELPVETLIAEATLVAL